jgi:hypothetical protein
MQQQPKLVGNKAVTAEAIGFERYLQILDPVFDQPATMHP